MKISKLFFFLLICLAIGSSLSAQDMRKAFLLGENEEQYDQLRTEHARTLLTVFNNNEEQALKTWFQLMQKMEDYSDKIDFDLNGVKLFINVFWNADGTIAYVGALPKPDSKNVKTEDLIAFFSSYLRQNTVTAPASDRKYSHYTSVFFPIFAEKVSN